MIDREKASHRIECVLTRGRCTLGTGYEAGPDTQNGQAPRLPSGRTSRETVSDSAARTIAESIRVQLAAVTPDDVEVGVAVSVADVESTVEREKKHFTSSLVRFAAGETFEEPCWSRTLPVFENRVQPEAVAAISRELHSWALPFDDELTTLSGPVVIDAFAAADLLRALVPALARGALSPSLLSEGWRIADRGELVETRGPAPGGDEHVVILGDGMSKSATDLPLLVSGSWRQGRRRGFRSLSLETPESLVAVDANWPFVTRLIGLRGGLLAFGFDRERRFVSRADHLGEALLRGAAAVAKPIIDASGLPIEVPAVLAEL